MRLDVVLESFYALGSVWSVLTGPQLCSSNLPSSRAAVTSPVAGLPTTVTAFVDVNVVPMDTERVLRNQTVLISEGRIAALGPATTVKIPAGAVRIDGRGKYLMPGLGHGHDHETIGDLQGLVVQGDTVVTSPEQRHALARNLAEGVTAVAGGPAAWRFLKIPSPYFYVSTGLPTIVWRQGLDSMTAYLAARKAAGYAYINGSGKDSLLLVAAARAGLPVTWHADGGPSDRGMFEQVLRLGPARGSVEHVQFYEDSIVLGTTSDSPQHGAWQRIPADELRRKMQSLAAAIKRAGVYVTPTLRCESGPIGYWPADYPRFAHPLNVFHTKFKLQFTQILQQAGVPLLLSADDNWSPHDELTAFVQAGLTPYQALVAGTRNLAQYFGRLDSVGTVTVGKRADLVLLAGNPLQDIRHVREPAGVMVDGRWLDRTTLDQDLLASPKLWLQWVLRSRGDPNKFQRQKSETAWQLGEEPGHKHRAMLLALVDSLALALATPKTPEYGRLARRFAAELGALRALLPPEQQREWLDPWVRGWLRVQARQGHPMTIPGVTATP